MSTGKVCIIENCLYDILYLSVIEGKLVFGDFSKEQERSNQRHINSYFVSRHLLLMCKLSVHILF